MTNARHEGSARAEPRAIGGSKPLQPIARFSCLLVGLRYHGCYRASMSLVKIVAHVFKEVGDVVISH